MTNETQGQQDRPEPEAPRKLWEERVAKLKPTFDDTEDEYSFGVWSEIVKTYAKAVSEAPPLVPVGSPGMCLAMDLLTCAVTEGERILDGVANTIPRPPEAPHGDEAEA